MEENENNALRPCEKLSVLYSDYVDGELDPAGCQQVEEHLKICAPCRLDIALIREITRNLAQIPEEEVPADFAATVLRQSSRIKMDEEEAPSLADRIRGFLRHSRAAALVGAMAVLGIILVLQPSVLLLPPDAGTQVADARLQGPRMDVLAGPVSLDGRPVGRPVQVPLGKTVQVDRDGAVNLEYADDTRVAIRSATRLAACPEGVRLEAGTVYVAVQKRAVKPEEPVFRVLTDSARVSVWGTKFSVQTENGGTTVQVTEGVVGVEPMADGRVVGAESRVPAGQMARVDGKAVKLSPIVVPTAATGPSSVAEDLPPLRKP